MAKAIRGFAAMAPEKRRAIQAKGGRRAHYLGRAHVWTPEEAKIAGRLGGIASRGGRGKVSVRPEVTR
jgi:general stress protein YciG